MTRVTVAVYVLLVTAPAWAQTRVRTSSGSAPSHGYSAHAIHAAPAAPAMHAAPPMHAAPGVRSGPIAQNPHAYLPPRPVARIPTRIGPGVPEPRPMVPPGYAPSRFTGYCGGRSHVTYASGYYYPHLVVYPIGGYYPTYYQTYPWAGEAYDAPELEGLAIDEGYLELHVAPDAQIAIDGRDAGGGYTEGQRLVLSPGYHWVEVARDGFRSEVYNVSIAAGRVYPLRAHLSPLAADAPAEQAPPPPRAMPEKGSGTLSLRVAMAGARIFVDGEAWGAARADAAGFIVLPAGDHALRVDWPDGRTTISNVHVHDGDRIPLELSPPGE